MTAMSQNSPFLTEFRGIARLFPLPNLVLFPHVTQSLHIFEPRYRQLMADALADDRLIAMALLCPGWEEDYHKKPPIHPVICLGRILHEERLDDGRYNLLLQGLFRARILEELKLDRLYRVARVEVLDEQPATSAREQQLRRQLVETISPFFAPHPAAEEQVCRLVESGLSLGALCDVFCFALPMEVGVKQRFLEELNVEGRVQMLLAHLEGQQPPPAKEKPKRAFPPSFSSN
jgi:Lon protease-like protein